MRIVIPTLLLTVTPMSAGTMIMDASGSLNRQIPSISTSNGIVAVVYSPGTPSLMASSSDIMSLEQEDSPVLSCRGATLSGTSTSERTSLSATSIVAGSIIVDGITQGDVETGLSFTRHARTLTALIRARLLHSDQGTQSLILCVAGPVDDDARSMLLTEVRTIYDAVAVESKKSRPLGEIYNLEVVSVQSGDDANEVMSLASGAARSQAQEGDLADVLVSAQAQVRESGVTSRALDPPQIAQAFLACRQAYARQARAARAKLALWSGRVARGLCVDAFGSEAESLMQRTLQSYDTETLDSSGLVVVAPTRLELRGQLQAFLESGIRQLYAQQVSNLEKSALRKLNAQLLRRVNTPKETDYEESASILRTVAFAFDSSVADLEIPSLGLTKESSIQNMNAKLNDALDGFAENPSAQIKRMKKVTKVTSKERKPGQRAIDLGLDLVAMIRPDGFGSLQGFCGYNLGGNSVTVGVHNDADDAQVIAQFGGVRPPLLRFQPKLRVDVEL